MKKIKYFLILIIFASVFVSSSFAYVASSTNFRIESDVVSYGGGHSTSTSFGLYDSLSDRLLGFISSTGTDFGIKTGYIPMVSPSIAITYPSSVTLLPAIKSTTGGQGNGSASVFVITDNPGGYSLSIKASTDPALQGSAGSFANYNPATPGIPDFEWSIASTDSRFGFTPEGLHVDQRYKDDGTACNTGSGNSSDKCWDSITTTNKLIARSTTNNQPSGTATTIKLRSEAGANRKQPVGSYSSTIILTALPL